MSLRFKVNLVFLAVGVPVLLLVMLGIRHAALNENRRMATHEAALLSAEATATAEYVEDKVAPLVSSGGHAPQVFIPAAAPFYAVQAQANLLSRQMPGDRLRRVVLDPVGDADRPTPWERDVIMRLRSRHDPQPFTVERDETGGPHLLLISPLFFSAGVCATCYSSRSEAPPGILDAFGTNAGFDRHPGEIIGITVASVPLAGIGPIVRSALLLVLGLALALWIALNAAMQFLVLRPLGRMASVAEKVSLGQQGVAEFERAGTDEIGTVMRAFNRLRRSMESAIALLDT